MSTASKLREMLAREAKAGDLLKAALILAPLGAAYFISGEQAVSDLGLIAISLLIPAFRFQLPPKWIALHLAAILVTFGVLFLAEPIRPLFVLSAAVAAFLAAAVTRFGDDLRILGSWSFIPALYIACELSENAPSGESFRQAGLVVAFAPVVLFLVCAVQLRARGPELGRTSQTYGRTSSDWLLSASASAMAVFAAAALVEAFDLAQGQWLIWSAASVVVGDLAASANKLKLRMIGASVGVPLGFLIGLCLPPSRLGYSLAAMGALLTLVAFDRYVVGFAARCFFIALAALLAGSGSGIPEERVTNVFVGGTFGIVAVVLSEFVRRRLARKSAG